MVSRVVTPGPSNTISWMAFGLWPEIKPEKMKRIDRISRVASIAHIGCELLEEPGQ